MFEISTPRLHIQQQPKTGKLRLQRSRPNRGQPLPDMSNIIATKLPEKVGQISRSADEKYIVFCLSPDSWMLILPEAEADKIAKQIPDGLYADLVSDQYCCIRIEGETASELLSKASSIDFRETNFPANSLVTTKFSQITLHIEKLSDKNTFQLWIDQSLQPWLQQWLEVSTDQPEASGR